MIIKTPVVNPINPKKKLFVHVAQRLEERYGLTFGADQIRGVERYIRDKEQGERLFWILRPRKKWKGRHMVGTVLDCRWIYRVVINGVETYPVVSSDKGKIITFLPSDAYPIQEWRAYGRQLVSVIEQIRAGKEPAQ